MNWSQGTGAKSHHATGISREVYGGGGGGYTDAALSKGRREEEGGKRRRWLFIKGYGACAWGNT